MVICNVCGNPSSHGNIILVDFDGMGIFEPINICEDCADEVDMGEIGHDYNYLASFDFNDEESFLN